MVSLTTAFEEALTGTPWAVHPRPQMHRNSYVNLNGEWDFTYSHNPGLPRDYPGRILVPFCPESRLSGVEKHIPDGSTLFYRRKFTLPEGFHRGRVLLHIGAADQKAEIYVNQKRVGSHIGGYESFCFDITGHLQMENEVVICCVDDLNDLTMPRGKQALNRGGMWYTPVSGIWQTVWLESVPLEYVESLDIQVTLTTASITVSPPLDGVVRCEGREFPLVRGKATVTVENPRHWTPETPYLYDFTLTAGEDTVQSYFALRTLEIKTVDGIPRLCLNGKPYFFHGLLDQGYWSDGIFTPAAPEAYAGDILAAKRLGFNTLRKHIKVEPEQFYYDCDRLGMVVFQDMVNNGDYAYIRDTVRPTFFSQHRRDKGMHRDEATRQAFLSGMRATVNQLKNHPCICCWTIFNEGWGQFDSDSVYPILRKLDSSRFIDSTSGWFRQKASDVESLHIYFNLWHRLKRSDKPLVLSEFGGFTCSVPGHIFNPDKSYGYGACKNTGELTGKLLQIYRDRVIPAVKMGLCASIYTQISDVEDEINGLLTYDRRVCKPDPAAMNDSARRLQAALTEKAPV